VPKPVKGESDYYEKANNYAVHLYNKHNYSEAKSFILQAISDKKPVQSPYVENGILHVYALNKDKTCKIPFST
jgi:hypothetical protein